MNLTETHSLPPFPPTAPLPKTVPDPEEWLLLRVSHAALNPADLVTLSVMPFFIRSHRKTNPAAVPGMDFTGEVIDVWHPAPSTPDSGGGEERWRLAKGDEVVCFPPLAHALATGVGGLQGVVALPARYAVKIPEGKTKREAAGLFLAGCTADVQVNECGVKAGQRVLVIGASGGVGTMVVQMVRDRVGAEGRVVAICSGKNEEMVRGLGADEVSFASERSWYISGRGY
jgi:NADPH:quinone reductase-like Zn-dependent oxidoreductase